MTDQKIDTPSESPFASWRGHHVGLRVPDHAAALAWYEKVLGFRATRTLAHGETTFTYLSPAGEEGFAVELVANPKGAARPGYTDLADSHKLMGWHHVCIRCADVNASVAVLKQRGVTIVSEPFDVAGLQIRIAFFADPGAICSSCCSRSEPQRALTSG